MRSAPLRRTGFGKRGNRKPRGRPTDEQIEAKQRAACFLARFSDKPCSGRMRLCHLIPAQRLRNAGVPEDDIWDERVVVNGCDSHHHALDYARTLRIPRDQLPPGLEQFAAEHGMEGSLSRDYGERVQVAFMECDNPDCHPSDPRQVNDSGNHEYFVYEGDPDSAYNCPLCGKPGRRYPY